MKLIITKVPNYIEPEVYDSLSKCITRNRRLSNQKLRFKEDKYRSLIGELLIRLEILKRCKIDNHSIVFVYETYGKPKVELPNCHFNLSHSGDYVLMGISDSEVGVDIEYMKTIDFSVSEMVFSEKELVTLNSSKDQIRIFYMIWTAKESYIKANGTGFHTDVKKLSLSMKQPYTLNDRYIRLLDDVKGYQIAVCTDKPMKDLLLEEVYFDDIVMFFYKK